MTLSKSEIAALKNVQAGLVEHRFDRDGNVFVGPPGAGSRSYNKLAELRLIEDMPGQKATGVFASFLRQRLTAAGLAALRARAASERGE